LPPTPKRWVGFVKKVGFKPRVKERENYRLQNGESEEEEVTDERIDE